MFSATGNVLSGSIQHPDIYTLLDPSPYAEMPKPDTRSAMLNILGYVPVISTISGCCRVLLGIIHTIVHLVAAIFKASHRKDHLQEALLGVRNIVRGIVEMVPVVGNITCLTYDGVKMKRQNALGEEYKKNNAEKCQNNFILFTNEGFFEKTIAEMNVALAKEKIARTPTYWEVVKLIQV